MNFKILTIFLTILTALLLLSGTAMAFTGNGAGTPENPYQIETIAHLKEVNGDLAASYILMNNLDIDEGGWKTLGRDNSAYRFTGVFDGNHFTITFTQDTEFTSDDSTGYGLFGAVTDDAELKNIKIVVNGNLTVETGSSGDSRLGVLTGIAEGRSTIVNCSVVMNDSFSINGNNMVGGLAGVIEVGTISSSHFIGTVKGNDNVGGLAGFVKDSVIYSSYVAGNVEGMGNPVGGLAGKFDNSTADSCYFSGNVEGNKNVGGLAGYVYSSTISDSYVLGTVAGNGSTGGLVGDLTFGAPSFIENCFSAAYVTGNVTGADFVGGIIGAVGYNDGVTDCFYVTGNVSGGDNGVGTAVANSDLTNILTFENNGWSIYSSPDSGYIWYINDGEYPQLCWQYVEPVEEPVMKNSGGSGFGRAIIMNLNPSETGVADDNSVSAGNSIGNNNSNEGDSVSEKHESEGYENQSENESYRPFWMLFLFGFFCLIGMYIVIKRVERQ